MRRISAEQWAEREDFDQPVRWGQVERSLVRRRLPLRQGERALEWLGTLAGIGAVLVVLPFLGSPAVALVTSLAARRAEGDAAQTWLVVTTFALLVAAAVGGACIIGWWLDRESTTLELGLAAVVAGFSLATVLVLRGTTDVVGVDRTTNYALAATATGTVGLVLCAVSKPILISPFSRRDRNLPKHRWQHDTYLEARSTVLTVLERRGLVHLEAAQRQKIDRMKLGTWHRLDPDEGTAARG